MLLLSFPTFLYLVKMFEKKVLVQVLGEHQYAVKYVTASIKSWILIARSILSDRV